MMPKDPFPHKGDNKGNDAVWRCLTNAEGVG
jgi:hypothetical protein